MRRDQTSSSSSLPCRFSEFRTTRRSLPRKQHSSRASVWRQCWWIYRTRKQWCALSPRISHGASVSLCLCCVLTFFFSPSFFLISLSAWKVEAGESKPKGKVLKIPPLHHMATFLHTVSAEWVTVLGGGGVYYGLLWDVDVLRSMATWLMRLSCKRWLTCPITYSHVILFSHTRALKGSDRPCSSEH